jgi:hypothetical protein
MGDLPSVNLCHALLMLELLEDSAGDSDVETKELTARHVLLISAFC